MDRRLARVWLGGKVNGLSSLAIFSTRCADARSMRSPPSYLLRLGLPIALPTKAGTSPASSGRFAMIDDGLGFQLVPWRPALEQRLGQQVSGTLTPGGRIDWSFGRRRGLGI